MCTLEKCARRCRAWCATLGGNALHSLLMCRTLGVCLCFKCAMRAEYSVCYARD
jgi:hypothetical protein